MSIVACSVDGCEKPHYGKTWCQMHYNRMRKTGILDLKPKMSSYCRVESCGVELIPPYGRGMCSLHYKRFMKYGTHELPHRALLRDSGCRISGCKNTYMASGLCSAHYTRLKRTGSPVTRKRGQVVDGKRICATCGADTPIEYMSNSAPSYCRPCFNAAATARRVYEPVLKMQRDCAICSTQFMGDKRNTRCCGASCLKEYKRLNDIELAKRRPREVANASNRAWYQANKDTAFAAKAAYRARKIAAHVEDVRREVVFERDGYLCRLCSTPLRVDVKAPHPHTPSIDHIVPLSRGGDHSYANIQSAHLACNVAKGARIS